MTSEGPRHASPEQAESAAEFGAAPPAPWSQDGPPAPFAPTMPPPAPAPPGPGTSQQATGPVRASASVPAPAVPPQPYGAPVPPPQGFPPAPASGQFAAPVAPPAPAAPATASPFVPAQGGAASGGPAGGVRVTGTAQMPEGAILPAHQLPPLPVPVPRVYGRPAGPPPGSPPQPQVAPPTVAAPPSMTAPPHLAGPPHVARAAVAPPAPPPLSVPPAPPLLAPPLLTPPVAPPGAPVAPPVAPVAPPVAPGAPPVAPGAPPGTPAGSPLAPMAGPGGGLPAPSFGPPGAGFDPTGRPTPPREGGPPPHGVVPGQAASAAPGQRESSGAPAPARWEAGDYAVVPAESGGSHTGLLIAVGIVVLLAVVGLTAFMWPRGSSGPQFAVNSCVKQSGNSALPADCDTAGAFTIVSRVERTDQCPDRNQPYVELGSGRARILCLAPAGVPVTGPSGAPSATANPAST